LMGLHFLIYVYFIKKLTWTWKPLCKEFAMGI
jgi:hypothetical protein